MTFTLRAKDRRKQSLFPGHSPSIATSGRVSDQRTAKGAEPLPSALLEGRRSAARVQYHRRKGESTFSTSPQTLQFEQKPWVTVQGQRLQTSTFTLRPLVQRIGFWKCSVGTRRSTPRRILLRRAFSAPAVHYRILQLHLVERVELENAEGAEQFEQREFRFLLLERHFPRVGFGPLLEDALGLFTPAVKLTTHSAGHKTKKHTVYQVRENASLPERRRILLQWLRQFVSKNPDYNFLRRNVTRKSNSKKVRLIPPRSDRLKDSFFLRFYAEGKMLLQGDERIREKLDEFDRRVGKLPSGALKHFR